MTDDATPVRPVTFHTVGEAAEACEVSSRTIRRRLSAGEVPGAERDDSGRWTIPATGLVAAGLQPSERRKPPRIPIDVEAVVAERDALRREISGQRARAELAEQLAAERAEHVADLRRALDDLRRMLPAETIGDVQPAWITADTASEGPSESDPDAPATASAADTHEGGVRRYGRVLGRAERP